MNIDIKKTKEYYNSFPVDFLCDCDYCKNYYLQIKSAYPQVSDFLASKGIDIEKPFELFLPTDPDEEGVLEYFACQYIAFGSCQDSYSHKIGDIDLHITTSHPGTEIEDEHFVLELSTFRLKWLIQK